ncbi:MAG: Fic family protein [Bacteroidetes bacterium]|nr:Fic family protein [Bacteroidota bacterium]
MPYPVWLLLGEATALSERLQEVTLPPDESALLDYAALLRGVLANASLDGNSLTEDQVDRLFEGSLQLPPSQQFLGVEVQNLVKAVRWAQDRVRARDRDLGPWVIQAMNAQVLKGLPTGGSHAPGEYRTARHPSAGVAAEDIGALLERWSDWLAGPLFAPEHPEERTAFAIIQAILAHLYLHWIQPFPEGNGRTARLVELQILLQAGMPALAAHRLAQHAGATRSEYQRQLVQAAQAGGDPIPFIAYMVRGFVDGLRTLWAEVEEIQHQSLWDQHMGRLFADAGSAHGARQLRLVQDLRGHGQAVPPGRVAQLSAELARYYARLHPKTLQRDLNTLQEQGLVERTPEGVRARPLALKPFRPAR